MGYLFGSFYTRNTCESSWGFLPFFPPPPKHLLNSNRQRTAAFTRCTDRKAHRADAIVVFSFINTIDTTRWSHWQQPHQRFRDLITRMPKTVVTAPVGKWELYYITQTLYIQSLSKHFTYTVSPEKNWLQRILGARPRSLTSNTSEHFTTNRADLSMPDSWKKQPPRTLHINVLYKLLLHNDVLYKKTTTASQCHWKKHRRGFSELQRQWRRDVGERNGKCMTNSRGGAVVAPTLTQAWRFSPALKTFGRKKEKEKKSTSDSVVLRQTWHLWIKKNRKAKKSARTVTELPY